MGNWKKLPQYGSQNLALSFMLHNFTEKKLRRHIRGVRYVASSGISLRAGNILNKLGVVRVFIQTI
jgi:hypothetical protein